MPRIRQLKEIHSSVCVCVLTGQLQDDELYRNAVFLLCHLRFIIHPSQYPDHHKKPFINVSLLYILHVHILNTR